MAPLIHLPFVTKKTVFAVFKGKDAKGRVQDALDHIHSFVDVMVSLLGRFDGLCNDITRSLTDHSKILEYIRPPNPSPAGVTSNNEAVVEGISSKTASVNLDKTSSSTSVNLDKTSSSTGLNLDALRIPSLNPDDISATLEEEIQNINVSIDADKGSGDVTKTLVLTSGVNTRGNRGKSSSEYNEDSFIAGLRDKSKKSRSNAVENTPKSSFGKGGSGKTGHTELLDYLKTVYWRQDYVLDASTITDRLQKFLGAKYPHLNTAAVGPLVCQYVEALRRDKAGETKPMQEQLMGFMDEKLLASSGYAGYSGKRNKLDKFVKNIISNTNYAIFFGQHGS